MSTSTREGGEFGLELDLENVHTCVELEEAPVHVSPAEQAVVCGALGCRHGEHLVHVETAAARDRVLCPEHAAGFVQGEIE